MTGNPFRVAEPVDDAAVSAPDEGQRAVAAALALYQNLRRRSFGYGARGHWQTTLAKTIAAKIGGPEGKLTYILSEQSRLISAPLFEFVDILQRLSGRIQVVLDLETLCRLNRR
jgi:hypothetical protein